MPAAQQEFAGQRDELMKALIVTEAYVSRVGGGVRYEVDIVPYFRGKGH
jgi:hypothetical protein